MNPLRNVASLAPTRQAFSLFEEFKAFAFNGKEVPFGLFLGEVVNFLIIALVQKREGQQAAVAG